MSTDYARIIQLWPLRLGLCVTILLAGSYAAVAVIANFTLIDALHDSHAIHVDQQELLSLVADGQAGAAFEKAFEEGNELFETVFNARDGVGANVGQGQRFTRVPRADLTGSGEWARHFPPRSTGPNAQACNQCHNLPFEDGAGSAVADVHRDPFHTAHLGSFIRRNAPHLFALGAVQRLAEEMTEDLHHIRDAAQAAACRSGRPEARQLRVKKVSFGRITATCTTVDASAVEGVDVDLVVRPFQWKGSRAFIRDFNRDAAHNELGMQAVEIVGEGQDGDFDGVVDEMTVGDQTALAIYLAAQPRPTTRIELASLGLLDPLPTEEIRAINRGAKLFRRVGCADCHMSRLMIDTPIFSEPSQNPYFRDLLFPAGQDPLSQGVDPKSPITFDLTRDQPDNQIRADGNVLFRLGSLQTNPQGRAIVEIFGDLKRHDMGPGLAEPIDEIGTGPSVFLTDNLWGVASTAPYLHDGRATTLTEAILSHGGEATSAMAAFVALATDPQKDLIAFLNNLVLFKEEKDE
ncbi:MAG: hypothetical protein HYZ50_05625 [Deltaproteobacteria bacterium]|nr:hypothetical protein [Deltaproteobacteria bacterium]